MDATPTLPRIERAPKVLLHDHLDGGLRPATIVELADRDGYEELPTRDPVELAGWMTRGASRRDLVLYLETFAHTVGVLQTPHALSRVAEECVSLLSDAAMRRHLSRTGRRLIDGRGAFRAAAAVARLAAAGDSQ